MNDLRTINNKDYVSAKDVYNSIKEKRKEYNQENMTRYNDWISRLVAKYKFKEGFDFYSFSSKSSGGRPAKEYYVSLNMAQELCLLDNSEIGHIVRTKYIELADMIKQKEMFRFVGKEVRKSLTDAIQEKGINEIQHGHAYSNFTKLIYKKIGIEYTKEKNFRDKLTADQLKAIEILESLTKSYIEIGYDYLQIKKTLPDFNLKEIKE